MSKFFKLKEWLSLDEAVSYLASSLEEHVSLTDIYRLALDKHLVLSVRLFNQAYALGGRFVTPPYSDINCYPVTHDLATDIPLDEPYIICLDDALMVEDNKWLAFDEKVHVIDGVWDLTMIGMESLDIELLYQKELGGPTPVIANIRGVFLRQEELICKLQKRLPPEPTAENRADLQDKLAWILRSKGLTLEEFLNCDDLSVYLNEAEVESVASLFESMQDGIPDYEKFDDSLTLDDYAYQFVIKNSELMRFVQSLNEDSIPLAQSEKSLGVKERNTLLSLIYALLKEQKIDPSDRGVTSAIRLSTEKAGLAISENTIRKILKQISDIED